MADPYRRRPTASTTSVALLLLAAVLLLPPACSLMLPFDDECTTDEECADKEPGLRCVNNLCVTGEGEADVRADPDAGADTGLDIPDVPPPVDILDTGGPDPDVPADAGDGDSGSPPPDAADVPEGPDVLDVAPEDIPPDVPDVPDPLRPEDLLTDTCNRLYGVPLNEALDENTILIGSILPFTGQLELLGPFLDQALELAILEINGVGGLGGRKIAVLSCDSGTDPMTAIASATHLVTVARVPAIIGPVSSGITIAVFDNVTSPAGVLVISPVASSPVMETLSTNRLLWRTAPSATRLGYAFGEHLLAEEFQKVFVVNRDDTWGTSMREAMQTVYCASADCGDANRFRTRVYDTTNVAFSQSEVLVDVQAFDPDVVVLISYIEDGIAFLNAAQTTENVRDFITPDGIRDPLALDYVASQEILCRLFGMNFVSPAGPIYEAFRIRYESKWSMPPTPYTANAYDAAYLLAYAIAAASADGGELSGVRIGDGMTRLSDGQTIQAGSGQFRTGIQGLASSPEATIDYAGASGDVDFDPTTGAVQGNVEGWHFNLNEGGPESLGVIYTIDGTYTPPDYGLADADPVCESVLNPAK